MFAVGQWKMATSRYPVNALEARIVEQALASGDDRAIEAAFEGVSYTPAVKAFQKQMDRFVNEREPSTFTKGVDYAFGKVGIDQNARRTRRRAKEFLLELWATIKPVVRTQLGPDQFTRLAFAFQSGDPMDVQQVLRRLPSNPSVDVLREEFKNLYPGIWR